MEKQHILTFTEIRNLYPEIFGSSIRPLRVGILQDLVAAHPDQISVLKVFLRKHTSRQDYLMAVASGGPRYGLHGAVSGEVAESEQAHANALLRKLKIKQTSPIDIRKRSFLLKSFEASGLKRRQFAESQGIEISQLDLELSKAENERAERRAQRLHLVEAFERSGLSPEDFANREKISVGKLERTVIKVKQIRVHSK